MRARRAATTDDTLTLTAGIHVPGICQKHNKQHRSSICQEFRLRIIMINENTLQL